MANDHVIAIDYGKCTGCRICEVACSLTHTGETNPAKARIRIVKADEEGKAVSIPVVCMKCVNAACMAICPMGAISEDPSTGARVVDDGRCVACSACVYACPFGAIAVDRELACSFNCNHCEGSPTCVEFCPTGAIQYLSGDEVSIRMRRAGMDRFVNFVQSEPA
jgi:Fe-S-cluster-containing hydrogenase component 2